MARNTYPRNDLDLPRRLLALLGSFWEETYAGNDLVESIIAGRLATDLEAQVMQDLAADSVSRQTIPVWYRPIWFPVRFRASDVNTTTAALWRFDDPDLPTFDGTPGFTFDTPMELPEYLLPLPSEVVSAPVICNRITDQSLILLDGFDYRILRDRHGIVFKEDPFENSLIASQVIYKDGEIVDTEILLWFYRPEIDKQLIYRQFGYAIRTFLESSEDYKRIVNHVFDAITGCTSYADIAGLLAAMLGIRVVRSETETVELTFQEDEAVGVVTDADVYLSGPSTTPAVSEGDTVHVADSLIQEFQIYRLHRGQLPDDIRAIVLHRGLLDGGYLGELLFRNEEIPWVLDPDTGELSFTIYGHPLDVEKFWQDVYARQVTYGQTLKELLIQKYGTVPETVNPAGFLAEHVLRNNALLAKIRGDAFSNEDGALSASANLRKLLPPHETLLLILELEAPTDSVTMSNISDENTGGFDGIEPGADTVSAVADTRYAVRQVSFTCY